MHMMMSRQLFHLFLSFQGTFVLDLKARKTCSESVSSQIFGKPFAVPRPKNRAKRPIQEPFSSLKIPPTAALLGCAYSRSSINVYTSLGGCMSTLKCFNIVNSTISQCIISGPRYIRDYHINNSFRIPSFQKQKKIK